MEDNTREYRKWAEQEAEAMEKQFSRVKEKNYLIYKDKLDKFLGKV